jgi:endonuclease VIII
MPEGDTIYRAARALRGVLAGKIVTRFETGLAGLARVDDEASVVGRVVEKVESRGKWLLIYFSGDLILVTHMLMSGSWHLYRLGEKWRMPRSRMRVVIRVGGTAGEDPTSVAKDGRLTWGTQCGGWEAVAFNVPIAEFHTARSLERSSEVTRLGPDILAGEFTVEGGVARLAAYAVESPEAEVGVVLLNQRVLAGLGNVYKSEVAFAAGVNPFRAMRTVTPKEMEALVDFAVRYMRANVGEGADGGRRTIAALDREERLWVYRRAGQECRRCGGVVMMRKQGEQMRSTYWCPVCQPLVG